MKKAKVFSRPIRIFRKFFEGELRQWCSYLGSFRQWPFSLFVTRRTSVFFVDFVMNFSIICAAFQISTLISIKKSSKHGNLNLSLFAAGLHYDISLGQALEFNTKCYPAKSILIWWDKGECLRIKVALNSFYSQLWQTNILSVRKNCGIFF